MNDETNEAGKCFTRAEAEAKVGQRIRARVDFSSAPKGTTGRVVKAGADARGGHNVVVRWDSPGRAFPLLDWFSRAEYEKYLDELTPADAAKAAEDAAWREVEQAAEWWMDSRFDGVGDEVYFGE